MNANFFLDLLFHDKSIETAQLENFSVDELEGSIPAPQRKMINDVITICKLILVNTATSTSGKQSLSTT